MPANQLIFVSHAAVDQEIAIEMKRFLRLLFPAIDVFVSSDPEDLPLGDPWVDEVLEALDRASLVLLIASQRSLGRRWVWFEVGRTWFTNVTCVPCCVGQVRKSNLPSPLDGLTGMNLDVKEDVLALFERCAEVLGTSMASAKVSEAWSDFARLDVRAEEKQKAIEQPFHLELISRINEQMKQLDSGSREGLRLLLMYGELTDETAMQLVKESGKYTNSTCSLIGINNKTGWLKKTRSSPFPNVSRGEDAYIVNENMKSILIGWFDHNK